MRTRSVDATTTAISVASCTMVDPSAANPLRVAFGSPLHDLREVLTFVAVVVAAVIIAVRRAALRPPCEAAQPRNSRPQPSCPVKSCASAQAALPRAPQAVLQHEKS